MRLLIWASILLAGCADADREAQEESAIEVAGYLESKSLQEASGLARSNVRDDLLWAINDDGPADLYALGLAGEKRGKVRIGDASNRDWEDLASFVLDGTPYLMVADIGDNEARRKDVTLYVVAEPLPDADDAKLAWEIEFTYPDGPRDAEALAVDAAAGRILVLSKRDVPARLYTLPLRPATRERVTAEFLGAVTTLPKHGRRDGKVAPASDDWHRQPTAMDTSAANDALLILTYRGVYYYARLGDEAWTDTLLRTPMGAALGKHRNAEAIAFTAEGDTAFVTTEKKHAPLLRIDLSGAIQP